jgi:citrate lyase beta subunit
VNEVFTPTRAEYRAARAIIEELAAAGEAGRGAVASDGTMLDEASRRLASAVVARAQAAGVELAGA